MTKKKSLVGWILKEDFDLYEKMFNKDGVTHTDMFRSNPNICEFKDELKRVGLFYKKVRITI